MTFKDKAKWFSFEMSFVLVQTYADTCAYVDAYRGTLRCIFLFNLLSRSLGLCLRLVKTKLYHTLTSII